MRGHRGPPNPAGKEEDTLPPRTAGHAALLPESGSSAPPTTRTHAGPLGPPPNAHVDTGEQGASPAGAGGCRDSARLPAEAWGAGVPPTPLTTWVWTVRKVGPVQNQLVEVPPERQPLERSVWGCRPPSSWGVTGPIKAGTSAPRPRPSPAAPGSRAAWPQAPLLYRGAPAPPDPAPSSVSPCWSHLSRAQVR